MQGSSPRSRAAVIASGVQIVRASTFSPRTSRPLPWIFVWPNAALRGGGYLQVAFGTGD
jgi:hypothetical protein